MIFQMIEAVSRDGNFNLNIGLTPEGDLEPGGVRMWRDFGEFMRRNGEAVYGSSAWKIIGEDGTGGVDPRSADVTARVRGLIASGKLSLKVGNQTLGGDPAPDVPKALTIRYRLGGEPGTITRAENEIISLGGATALEVLDARFAPAVSATIPRAFPSGPIVREHAEFAMSTSDVRFTKGKDGAVYAFILAPPAEGEVLRIRALGREAGLLEREPASVRLLGSDTRIEWRREPGALVITHPEVAAMPFAVVYRVE
jgi:hypothetical protein